MANNHVPVLLEEVCAALSPALEKKEPSETARTLVDLTFGGGGHCTALIRRCRPKQVFAFDRDAAALTRALPSELASPTIQIERIHAAFADAAILLQQRGFLEIHAAVADLGVSSFQLDEGKRGFSFQQDAPLDMRMNPEEGQSAAELLATIDTKDLTQLLREYGEEPDARRIASAITQARPKTTFALAEIVTQAMSAPQRRKLGLRVHPATRTFQAIRIAINREFEQLDQLLKTFPSMLAVGGRLAVISFHSLEDRRIAKAFRKLARAPQPPINIPLRQEELPKADFYIPRELQRGQTPSAAEVNRNPRSRSARLRVLERCQ